ncbi:MAG: cytochrome c-type biogenesis protein CcmH [Gammaproteobacteria bacterium]|nr:cytochrome c-type biogenesis protein CcmH [Gammaproteobacteria bacterium]
MKKAFLTLFFLLIPLQLVFAVEDEYHFNTEAARQQFEGLTTELRCLVCQNQNLAESNAALAVDLRTQIYQKVLSGQSSPEIVDYLVKRYGDFILYRPPFKLQTLGLWLGPFVCLIFGLFYLIFYIKNQRRR